MNHSPAHTAMLAKGGVPYRGPLHKAPRGAASASTRHYTYAGNAITGAKLRRLRWILEDEGKGRNVDSVTRRDYRVLVRAGFVTEQTAQDFRLTLQGRDFVVGTRNELI